MTPEENFNIHSGSLVKSVQTNSGDKGTTTIKHHKLSIRNLDAWFGSKQALKNINLDVKSNTTTAIIGPSGCGKTTLIRCLNR
ncbi:MAG TPA: ATP-binding cassette domain-containing protein, partial [Nitrososphaeraceae archaeon]|nr:ATP-binding cassette domain-containing protein [Nitrososphaeraceae archaeon]